jgi:uncharacterized protein YndB with AHSA1/START domain
MNILITILIVIVGIIALLLITALFTKKTYTIEKEVLIHRRRPDVFEYIQHLKNQSSYNKWMMADPDMRVTYTGVDGTVGFKQAWDSDNKQVGKGEQEITAVDQGVGISTITRFIKPMEGIAHLQLATEVVADHKTKVKWSFQSGMKYPMNILIILLNMPKMLGKDLEKSLELLRAELEDGQPTHPTH